MGSGYVTAQVLLDNGKPLGRTTVRTFLPDAIENWHEPSAYILNRYEDFYGVRAERT